MKFYHIYKLAMFRVAAVLLCIGAVMPLSVSAQQPTEAPVYNELPERIKSIQVVGNQRVEANTVASYLLIAPGDPYSDQRIDLSIKTLFRTGLFADVAIEPRDGNILIRVVENPIINRVIIEGNKSLKEDKITDEIEAEPRALFTRSSVQADVQRIIELYRQSGRFAATVSPKVIQQPQNRIDLVFEITEGPVTGVKQINFIGNKEFSDRDLRKEIVTAESSWYKFFSSNDNYDPGRLQFDQEQVRNFYTDRGFADFRVVSAVAELTPDQEDFYITFTLDEGEEYTWGDIEVETELETLNETFLRGIVPIRPGDIYKSSVIESAIETLTFATGTSGYAFVDIQPAIRRNRETKTVDVTFEISEGPRVYIDKINIVGNTTTLDYVVRRELELAEGDAFNRILLDRSRLNVRRLRFFEDVEITETQGSAADRAIVEVKVKEQPTGELAFSAGFSSQDAFLVDLSVTQRNLRGRGQLLRFLIQASSNRRTIDLQFQEPRFLGRNLSAGLNVFDTTFDFLEEAGFRQSRRGATLTFGFPLTQNTQLLARYSLRNEEVDVPAGTCIPVPEGQVIPVNNSSLCDAETGGDPEDRISSILGYTFIWDRRNDPITPTGGFNLSFTQDFAGIGGDARYIRSELRANAYKGILPGVVLSLEGQAGYIQGWGGDPVRINDRFFKGSNDFRGFDNAGVGPRLLFRQQSINDLQPVVVDENGEIVFDENGQTQTNFNIDPETGEIATENIRNRALGGNAFALAIAELSFPVGIPQLEAALFAEAGTVGLLDDEFLGDRDDPTVASPDNNISGFFVDDSLVPRVTVGASVYWESPFGPIRFDFTKPLVQQEFDDRESFQFTTSTRF